jgi:hypothetical protein
MQILRKRNRQAGFPIGSPGHTAATRRIEVF